MRDTSIQARTDRNCRQGSQKKAKKGLKTHINFVMIMMRDIFICFAPLEAASVSYKYCATPPRNEKILMPELSEDVGNVTC
jgi:hypothetical protein